MVLPTPVVVKSRLHSSLITLLIDRGRELAEQPLAKLGAIRKRGQRENGKGAKPFLEFPMGFAA